MRIRKDIVMAKLVAYAAGRLNGDVDPIWYTCPFCAAVSPLNRVSRDKHCDLRHCLDCLALWIDRFVQAPDPRVKRGYTYRYVGSEECP